jgi:hypothetical protein
MDKFSKDLLQGMREACEFAEGKVSVARIHVVNQREHLHRDSSSRIPCHCEEQRNEAMPCLTSDRRLIRQEIASPGQARGPLGSLQ